MEAITTKRLELRTLRTDDLDAAMNFWGNDEVMQYCGGSSNSRNRIANAIRNYINSQRERGFSAFAVVLKEENEVIGACGFNYDDNENEVELIYHFAKEYWGKGYATEAAKTCVEYAYKNIRANKIIASVDPRNEASKRVLEKLGFRYAGTKWFEDISHDCVCYELNL